MLIPMHLCSTLLIWGFFTLILLSDRRSLRNRLCFCGGMLFSLGTFKEYLYYDLIPQLETLGYGISQESFRPWYSVMTSVLYLCAMPAAVLFAVRFSEVDRWWRHPKRLLAAMAVPAAVFACCFPPWETYGLQRTSFPFWLSACIYNLTYGVLFTVLMALAVRRAATPKLRRQKKTATLLVLPLMWYWLVTIFVFHTLRLQGLLKLWEWNSLLVAAAICFYLYLAFHDGIMGVRLNAEHYRWEAESQTAFRGAQFMAHALKHDLTKLSWCAENLSRGEEPPPEAAVVSHAVEHLTALQERICMQTGTLELRVEECTLWELMEGWNLEEYGHRGMALVLDLERKERLLCDRFHTAEVMRNLLDNAWEAAGPDCTVRLALRKRVRLRGHRGRFDRLTVADNGPGVSPQLREKLFQPYQTDKNGDRHMGLGLFYCAKVMRAHGGAIQAEEGAGRGCTIALYFPSGRP